MKKKLLSILALLCMTVSGAWAQHQPSGNFETAVGHEGSISVTGWAWDQDKPNTPISVHVYVFKDKSGNLSPDPSNSNVEASISITANNYRSDIISVTSDNGNHGFAKTFEVNATPGNYYVCAYGIDNTDGNILLNGVGKDITIQAPYSVTYNANGGSGAPSAQEKCYDITLTLSSTVPTRDGYTFAGWATSAEGAVTYSAGGSYTTNDDIVLYAQWTPTYTATFATGNDNTGWTIAPTSDVEGATVTVSYTGENKVKSVTVQKRVAVGHELSSVSVGEIICSDGLAYAAADRNYLPTGVTASGMVVYLGAAGSVETGNSTYRGMAISLVDAPQVAGTNIGATTGPWANGDVAATDVTGIANVGGSYSNAVAELKGIANTAYMMVWWPNAYNFAHNRAHNYAVAKPSDTSDWFEPTLGQWARMMDSFGGSFVSGTYDTKSATAVSNLNTALTNAGGTALSADLYWLSTEINNSEAAYFSAYGGQFGYHGKDTSHRVRAFFAF